MSISLNELLHYDYFKSLELIAGAGGGSRQVLGCSILDYEMDRSLNQKYANLNFLPERMVVPSLLFAKNAPFMIRDAVKYLISKDASALVIKNVFRLPIHESILRYAASKNFPIFRWMIHICFSRISLCRSADVSRSRKVRKWPRGRSTRFCIKI